MPQKEEVYLRQDEFDRLDGCHAFLLLCCAGWPGGPPGYWQSWQNYQTVANYENYANIQNGAPLCWATVFSLHTPASL